MSRRVKRKLSHSREKVEAIIDINPEISDGECLRLNTSCDPDWTSFPDDIAIRLFSYLNYRDQASLSSTCRAFRLLGSSPCLWESLDLRLHKFDVAASQSLSSRSKFIRKLQFRGEDSANAIISLQARELREITGDCCWNITDATLSVIAARHEMLESLKLGPYACERISSEAIKAMALCCPMLRRLHLIGVREINEDAINALARHSRQLEDVAFMESDVVDGMALGNLDSTRFLSVAGTTNLKWSSVSQAWSKLPKLVGLDVSRTDISMSSVMKLLSSSQSLKVLLALNCPAFESEINDDMRYNLKGKILLTAFNDISKAVASLFANNTEIERSVFSCRRKIENKDRCLDAIVTWVEWILSIVLLRIAESKPKELDFFWLKQGAELLLTLLQSPQEDVQERAATAIATFVVIDDENAIVDFHRTEAVVKNTGIRMLLDLARSHQEGLQSEAVKAIANLSVDPKVAKVVTDTGGIKILTGLARSMNRLVAEEAAGGLWNLSVGEEHKDAIAEAGGTKALIDIIFRWHSNNEGVIERAAGALANLAADSKCSIEIAAASGIRALVMLTRFCKFETAQEQAARALSNMAAHGGLCSNVAAIGKEAGAIEALVQLTYSQYEGVRQEAAGALWNLSFDDKNQEAIAAAGGIAALVSLAQSSSNYSQGLQERAAGALWGLSVSEANSVAIGQEGGIAPLIVLASSDVADVHETAAGALWNLAFNPGNALRIVEDGGVAALVHICSSSQSKMARFMAALAMAYIFDGRMDEVASFPPSSENTLKNLTACRRMVLNHLNAFVHSLSDPQMSSPSVALVQIAEAAFIPEAGHLRCSAVEIGRFIAMLRNPSPILKACSAFALFQFTMPAGQHAIHHTNLLQNAAALRVLRATAAAATAQVETKVFTKLVLRNLEYRHVQSQS